MTPDGKIYKNSVPKVFIMTPIDVLCSNFVKFGWREMGEIVLCLRDKKKISHGCHFYADGAQNLPGSAPDNVLQSAPDCIHIRSLSAEV